MSKSPGERLAERLKAASIAFARHHANAVPDSGFAARVADRLTIDPALTLGWVAVRLLPASLLLVIVLGYVSMRVTAANEVAAGEEPKDDVIAWILDGREAKR